MKVPILTLSILLFSLCTPHKKVGTLHITIKDSNLNNPLLTINNHCSIVDFILKKGDKVTFSSAGSSNPHYNFHEFDAFLTPPSNVHIVDCSHLDNQFDLDKITILLQFKAVTKEFVWLEDEDVSENTQMFLDVSADVQNQKLYLNVYYKNSEHNKENNAYVKEIERYFEIMLDEINNKNQ